MHVKKFPHVCSTRPPTQTEFVAPTSPSPGILQVSDARTRFRAVAQARYGALVDARLAMRGKAAGPELRVQLCMWMLMEHERQKEIALALERQARQEQERAALRQVMLRERELERMRELENAMCTTKRQRVMVGPAGPGAFAECGEVMFCMGSEVDAEHGRVGVAAAGGRGRGRGAGRGGAGARSRLAQG